VQSAFLRHTELQPPTRSLENGDFTAKAIAVVAIIAASKNMHNGRFMVPPVSSLVFFLWV
jgi:hypothetical protein